MNKDMQAFQEFLNIIKTLRGPDGCPWDRKQTPATMRGHLLEEVYEALEAIDTDNPDHIREELGDVLMIVGVICRMYDERGQFSMGEVLDEINAKLIRRHPHVFGNVKADKAEEALKNWERVKVDIEGRRPANSSTIDGVLRSLPPLERAYKLQRKAAKKGFDWPGPEGPREKILEELDEITASANDAQREEEIGDLMFSAINYARHLGIDPAVALLRVNAKFEKRFRFMEESMNAESIPMTADSIDVMNAYWEAAKATR